MNLPERYCDIFYKVVYEKHLPLIAGQVLFAYLREDIDRRKRSADCCRYLREMPGYAREHYFVDI